MARAAGRRRRRHGLRRRCPRRRREGRRRRHPLSRAGIARPAARHDRRSARRSAVRAVAPRKRRRRRVGYLGVWTTRPAASASWPAGRHWPAPPIPEAACRSPPPPSSACGRGRRPARRRGRQRSARRPMTVRWSASSMPLPAAGWDRDPLGGGRGRPVLRLPRLPPCDRLRAVRRRPRRPGPPAARPWSGCEVTAHPELAPPERPALDAVDATVRLGQPAARRGRERPGGDGTGLVGPAGDARGRPDRNPSPARAVLVVVLLPRPVRRGARPRGPARRRPARRGDRPARRFGAQPAPAASSAPPSRRSPSPRWRHGRRVPLAGLATRRSRGCRRRRGRARRGAAVTGLSVLAVAVGASALAALLVLPGVCGPRRGGRPRGRRARRLLACDPGPTCWPPGWPLRASGSFGCSRR